MFHWPVIYRRFGRRRVNLFFKGRIIKAILAGETVTKSRNFVNKLPRDMPIIADERIPHRYGRDTKTVQ